MSIETGKSGFALSAQFKPKHEVTFHNGDHQIGRLDFNGSALKFEGRAEESARVFIDFLAERFAGRLKEEREACAKICEQLKTGPRAQRPTTAPQLSGAPNNKLQNLLFCVFKSSAYDHFVAEASQILCPVLLLSRH